MPVESALWFLPALFWVEIFYLLIDKKMERSLWKVLTLITITIIGVYWTRVFHYLPWSLNSAMSAIGFFGIGRWFKVDGESKVKAIKASVHKRVQIMILLLLTIVFGYNIVVNGFINIRTGTFGFAPLGYLSATVYTMLIYMIAIKITHMRWLENIGRYSIIYLLTNHPVLLLSKNLLTYIGMTPGSIQEVMVEFLIAMVIMWGLTKTIINTPLRKVVSIR